jgi:alcohol dehydrogenase class IV
MVVENLPAAVSNGKDVKARQEMMMASCMGAVAFQKGLGVVHSLAHPLSSVAGISHGLANAIMLPHAIRFNAKALEDNVKSMAHALGSKDLTADGAALAIEELATQVGLPDSLGDAGVNEDQIPELVGKALEDGCHGTNPRECTADSMEALYTAAM